MIDTKFIDSIAEELPPEKRESFRATMQRVGGLPEEDEIFQLFDAFGCLARSVSKVPAEISEILENARSGLTDEQRDGLRDDMEAMFKKSVDTPSYKDLRELVRQMQVVHGQVTREVHDLSEPIRRAGRPHKMIVFGTVAGVLLSLVNALVLAIVLSRNLEEPPKTDADTLALFNSGRLTYAEVETPEFGLVGVVRVDGEIMGALEGEPTNRDYIFMRPISHYRGEP